MQLPVAVWEDYVLMSWVFAVLLNSLRIGTSGFMERRPRST